MNSLINLLKDHQVAIWCKRAAWVILGVGLVQIILNVYNVSRQFGAGQPLTLGQFLQILGFGLDAVPSLLFFFFMLYAAAAVVNHFVDSEEEDDEAHEDQDSA